MKETVRLFGREKNKREKKKLLLTAKALCRVALYKKRRATRGAKKRVGPASE